MMEPGTTPTPEEQIIAQAQKQVAARRTARQHPGGPWPWLLPLLVLAVVMGFALAPGTLPEKLLWLMGGICGLRPAHSYFAGDLQLPIEARMLGIYGGASLTLLLAVAARRVGSQQPGSPLVLALLALFFGSMVVDGVNSTLITLGLPHLYETTNLHRISTGLLSGIAVGAVLAWLVGTTALPPSDTPPPRLLIRSPWELLAPLALCGLFAALVISEAAWVYAPVALLSVGGVIAVLTLVALVALLQITGQSGGITRMRQGLVPGSLAFLLAVAFLVGSALVRWSVTGAA
jgi:uncharacterized membrane protein